MTIPYADPDRQREFNRNLYRNRYQQDPEFRASEALRKGEWYLKHQPEIIEKYRLKRTYLRKIKKAAQGVVDLINTLIAHSS